MMFHSTTVSSGYKNSYFIYKLYLLVCLYKDRVILNVIINEALLQKLHTINVCYNINRCFVSVIRLIIFKASVSAATLACDRKRARLWVQFPLREVQYLIFSFVRSGAEAKARREFRHSKRNDSRISRKMGIGVS